MQLNNMFGFYSGLLRICASTITSGHAVIYTVVYYSLQKFLELDDDKSQAVEGGVYFKSCTEHEYLRG